MISTHTHTHTHEEEGGWEGGLVCQAFAMSGSTACIHNPHAGDGQRFTWKGVARQVDSGSTLANKSSQSVSSSFSEGMLSQKLRWKAIKEEDA